MLSRPERKRSSFPNLLAYLKPGNLLKLAVSLLALSSLMPSASAGSYLRKNSWTGTLNDNECLNAHPDCMLEVRHNGVDKGVNSYQVKQYCDDIPAVRAIDQQMRDSVFMGKKLCEGKVSNIEFDERVGIAEVTEVTLKTTDAATYAVSQQSFFTKRKESSKPTECSTPSTCKMRVDGVISANNQYVWNNDAGRNKRFDCGS